VGVVEEVYVVEVEEVHVVAEVEEAKRLCNR